ncbi:DNA cytosine methyltransferase [Hwanghaeella grinnelliae]|uniref:Cytosine-specific methyltransferase n=2 Tax=Hwanghaeella grinnelliae TaxID=2500179 RepID=A0A3S2ZB56_9PROT|nr:DNA cytosine methyltransferase [Hwanghaeella grinnelliae]
MMTGEQGAPVFVDLFAGCGGLSLGLMQSGMSGLFAIEKDDFAFRSLFRNLVDRRRRQHFQWPEWLPRAPMSVEGLNEKFAERLSELRGQIDILAGGPPCQGFSFAGRRQSDDPRNKLFEEYLKTVDLLNPRVVFVENVRGFGVDFPTGNTQNYANVLRDELERRYVVHEALLDVSIFGVPQARTRYFLLALDPKYGDLDPFDLLKSRLPKYLKTLGISVPVSAQDALSDLELTTNGSVPSRDTPGFREIFPGKANTDFQRLMRQGLSGSITDLRLARHRADIAERFRELIAACIAQGRLNVSIGPELRAAHGLKKQALRVMDPFAPAPTITSMPDDLLHYSEPRTLTVRENARLQSFPDWFSFHGKYTSGGDRRSREVPRFTQVANAVPPMVARAIGETLISILHSEPKPALESSSLTETDLTLSEASVCLNRTLLPA